MIGFSQSVRAKKYAKAYLNLFEDKHTFQDYYSMWRAAQFLSEHHDILFYLSLSMVDDESKKRFIDLFIEKFHLFDSLKSLFYLLLKNKTIFLAADVLRDIFGLYKRRNNVADLRVTSSVELSFEDIDVIKQFFKKKALVDVVVHQHVDPTLIAGLRLQTDTLLWEYSIAGQLRDLEQKIVA